MAAPHKHAGGPPKVKKKAKPAPARDAFTVGTGLAPPAKPKTKLKPAATAPFKAGTAPYQERQVAAIDDAIVGHRNAQAMLEATRRRIAATAGLPDAKQPFRGAGAQEGSRGARDTYQPDLTDKATLARATLKRLAGGGLLPKAEREAEDAARDRVTSSRAYTFADTHTLPAELSRPAVSLRDTAPAHPHVTRQLQSVRQPTLREQIESGQAGPRVGMARADARSPGGNIDWGALMGAARKGVGTVLDPASLLPALPGSAGDVQGYLNTTQRFMFPNPLEIAGAAASGRLQREAAGATRTAEKLQQKAASLRPSPSVPHQPIDIGLLTPEVAKAAGAGQGTIYLDDVIAKYGEGALDVRYRKQLIDAATKKQGWPDHDTNTWTDADAAARAFTPYKHSALGFAQNAAADIAVLAAGGNIVPMLAQPAIQAAQGNFRPLARTGTEFVNEWRKHLAFVGDRPFLENLYETPFTTATSNTPFVRAAGVRFGKLSGLKPTREVTLPTTGAVRRIPATQNAITRPLTTVTDRILARGAAPEPRTGGPRGIPQHAQTVARGPVEALGRRMERRHVASSMRLESNQIKLETAGASARASRRYMRAIKDLPTIRRDFNPRGRRVESGDKTVTISDKQRRAESIIAHARLGFDSARVAEYFDGQAQRSRADAELELERAREQNVLAREAEEAGDDPSKFKDAAAKHETAARQAELDAKNQDIQADYSRANPVTLAELGPKEKELIAAARDLGRVTTATKLERGGDKGLGEQGALYGDLQHNLEITRALEPESRAGQMARVIDQHRTNMKALEARMPEGNLSDRRSPAAQATLGRARQIKETLKDVRNRRAAVAKRLEATRSTTQRRAGGSRAEAEARAILEAEDAARAPRLSPEAKARLEAKLEDLYAKFPEHHPARVLAMKIRVAGRSAAGGAHLPGETPITPATQRRIIDEGRSALTAKRERRSAIAAETRRSAEEIEASERAAHEKVSNAKLQKTRRDLRSAQYRTNSPTASIAREAQREVERLTMRQGMEQSALENFAPTERMTKAQARADRLEAKAAATTLSDGELSAIARKHLGAEERSISKEELYTATHEGVFEGADRELARLEARHQASLEEADARYNALAGSRAELALRHEEESRAFQAAMEQYQELRQSQGIDPFHAPLALPGSKRGAAPVKQSENLQFPTGNFTNDVHIQLAADLEGWTRRAVTDELFKRAAEGPYVLKDVDPLTPIPPGYTLTDSELLKTRRREVMDAEGNKAYDDLAGAWSREADEPHRYVPDDGKKYSLVAKDAQDWITHELSVKGTFGEDFMPLQKLLAFTNAYRRWMLFTLPRTLVNNAVGNPILAAMGGAGIMDYLRAIRILRKHPDQIPHLMLGRGPLYNALDARKLSGYQSTLRDANVFHEDLGRLTLYVHHAVRHARKEQGLRFYQRVSLGNEKMTALLKDLAEGRDPKVHEFMDFANQWFGDMAKRGKWDPILSSAVLFHRWVGHMIKLTLWTMPAKYPGRTALLLNLSRMADNYRREHGVWPDWASSIVGLWERSEEVSNKAQKVIWGLNTGGAQPFATAGQTLSLGSDANPKIPLASVAAANLNPALRLIFEQASGRRLDTWEEFKDQYGNPTGAFDWRVLLNSLIGNTPVLSTAFSRTGLADTSIQVLPNAPRRYSAAGSIDPAYYPPRPTGHGFWVDSLIRLAAAGGLNLRPVDSKGPRTELTAQKTVAYQAQQAKERRSRREKVDLGKQLAENRKRWANQRP